MCEYNNLKNIQINFNAPLEFTADNIKPLAGITGLYFIFLTETEIQYPFNKSRLIYIGMSEKRTNSIGKRLIDHFDGTSKNEGLVNYRKREKLEFTYINFVMLKNIWNLRIEDLESYFINDFVRLYGVYPICNNKTGYEIFNKELNLTLEIAWDYFWKGNNI